ncbi:protein transport protein SEC31-like [Tachyglossus aculeatus]|uniref:protein transport protein SEC31-like n=1 Tax=Tachyglossus aculeatus TaxID=9261 RepID=UPI0018F411E9|nr:protein transport protein SEC31-like [Tachyglossus aculeatus]
MPGSYQGGSIRPLPRSQRNRAPSPGGPRSSKNPGHLISLDLGAYPPGPTLSDSPLPTLGPPRRRGSGSTGPSIPAPCLHHSVHPSHLSCTIGAHSGGGPGRGSFLTRPTSTGPRSRRPSNDTESPESPNLRGRLPRTSYRGSHPTPDASHPNVLSWPGSTTCVVGAQGHAAHLDRPKCTKSLARPAATEPLVARQTRRPPKHQRDFWTVEGRLEGGTPNPLQCLPKFLAMARTIWSPPVLEPANSVWW